MLQAELQNIPTIYDKIFLIWLTNFVILLLYLRFKTNYIVDFSDEDYSIFSLVTSIKKNLNPDGYQNEEEKDQNDSTLYRNTQLITLFIALYSLIQSDFDEIMGDPRKQIESFSVLIFTMAKYAFNFISVCYIFDTCISHAYRYPEENKE